MPTVFSHPAVPLALAVGLGRNSVPPPLLCCGLIASILPDLDVIGFRFGISYASSFGHRGFSHSLSFAVAVALAGTLLSRRWGAGHVTSFVFLFLAAASHGLLDGLTNGGLGISFFWPFSAARHFLPWQVIEVSPLSVSGFLSPRGLAVLQSELIWVWLPGAMLGLLLALARRSGIVSTYP